MPTPNFIQSILEYPFISRIRRNHGLEHATLHMLAQRFPRTSFAGHSDAGGFWIMGDATTDEIQTAVDEALSRLQQGERNLAVHPNCGTNLAAASILAGVAAALAMTGVGKRWRDKLERLPLAISLASLALMAAQPIGMILQREFTTESLPAGLHVTGIHATKRGGWRAHRITTRG
ncbi:MAG: hypothetical protein JW908_03375 [Anaerolineales bacterium]|nr:hypothetical protein [Anaerolineales bacterium]